MLFSFDNTALQLLKGKQIESGAQREALHNNTFQRICFYQYLLSPLERSSS